MKSMSLIMFFKTRGHCVILKEYRRSWAKPRSVKLWLLNISWRQDHMNAAELCQDFQQIMSLWIHEGPYGKGSQADASNRSLVPFILFRGGTFCPFRTFSGGCHFLLPFRTHWSKTVIDKERMVKNVTYTKRQITLVQKHNCCGAQNDLLDS